MSSVKKAPKTFAQAEALINSDPQPENIMDQLEKLRKKTPRKWRRFFDQYYEGAIAANNNPSAIQ